MKRGKSDLEGARNYMKMATAKGETFRFHGKQDDTKFSVQAYFHLGGIQCQNLVRFGIVRKVKGDQYTYASQETTQPNLSDLINAIKSIYPTSTVIIQF